MAKRRTRKQKQKAVHQFISWDNTSSVVSSKARNSSSRHTVKGQLKNSRKRSVENLSKGKYAENRIKTTHLGIIRYDLGKSILIASLILCLELVLYWFRG